MPITEVGLMGVKPNHKIMDDSLPEGHLLTSIYKNIISLPGGPSRIYWGLEVEDPLKLWAFFDWETLGEHEEFAKAFGAEAVKDLPTILTHGEFSKHVVLSPSPLVLQSPITEVLLAYFPSDISAAGKESTATQFQKLVEKSLGGSTDVKAVSYGWGVENDFPVRGEEGQRGSLLTAFIGWPSVEASMKVRETEVSRKNVELIQGIEGNIKFAMFQISCRVLERRTE